MPTQLWLVHVHGVSKLIGAITVIRNDGILSTEVDGSMKESYTPACDFTGREYCSHRHYFHFIAYFLHVLPADMNVNNSLTFIKTIHLYNIFPCICCAPDDDMNKEHRLRKTSEVSFFWSIFLLIFSLLILLFLFLSHDNMRHCVVWQSVPSCYCYTF